MVLIPPVAAKPGAYAAGCRDSGATRTLDPQLRRLLLYPTELRNRTRVLKNRRKYNHIFSFLNSDLRGYALSRRLHPVDKSLLLNYLLKFLWQRLK